MKALNLDLFEKNVDKIWLILKRNLGKTQLQNHTFVAKDGVPPKSSFQAASHTYINHIYRNRHHFFDFPTNIQVLPPIKHLCSIIGDKKGILGSIGTECYRGCNCIEHVQMCIVQ